MTFRTGGLWRFYSLLVMGMGVMIMMASGCINDDLRLYEVTLEGTVRLPPGAPEPAEAGRLFLEIHQAQAGEGELAYPLRRLETLDFAGLGPVTATVQVPIDDGDGLAIYAWLDVDGDGTLCAPGVSGEPAGIVELDGFPMHALSFELVLDTPCAGPESLW